MCLGPDGKGVIAALNPGGYGSNVYTDISKEPTEPAAAAGPQLNQRGEGAAPPQQAAALHARDLSNRTGSNVCLKGR